MMAQTNYRRIISGALQCSSYTQSVLRFGLPWILLYRGADYLIFRLSSHTAELKYPWRFTLALDIPVVFFVSAIWWILTREMAALKKKQSYDPGNPR
jgi:hypothetical protein